MVETFAVLADEFGALPPDALAPILQSALGLVRFDALRLARDAGGILAEGLDAATADALAAGCAAAGAVTHRVAQAAMVHVGEPLISRTFT